MHSVKKDWKVSFPLKKKKFFSCNSKCSPSWKKMWFSSGSLIYWALRIYIKPLAWFGHLEGNKIVLTFYVLLWNLYQIGNLKSECETSCIPSKSGRFLEAPANFIMKIVLHDVIENVGSCGAQRSCPSWVVFCSSTMMLSCSQMWHMFAKMVRRVEHMTCEERLREQG